MMPVRNNIRLTLRFSRIGRMPWRLNHRIDKLEGGWSR